MLGPGGPDSTFSINNLDPAAAYDLYLYAQNGGYGTTVTIFTINGASQYATNTGNIATFIQGTNYVVYQGLAPNASGVISGTFNVAKVADNAAFNGLQIVKTSKPNTNPPNITSVAVSNGSITIKWVNGGTLESSPSLGTPVWTSTGNRTRKNREELVLRAGRAERSARAATAAARRSHVQPRHLRRRARGRPHARASSTT